jgi:uncharacterized protein YjbI with pentapeptide repeats
MTPPAPNATGEESSSPVSLTKKQVMDRLRRGESLIESDLRGLDLSAMSFDGVDLSYAKMAECTLARCTFRGANLSGASLWQADLRDANFTNANLDDADMDMANLDGAILYKAKIRRTLFPVDRLTAERIQDSIRSGRRLVMDKDSG